MSGNDALHQWLRAKHGRVSGFARDMKISRQTVYDWLKGGIPEDWLKRASKVTRIPEKQLRRANGR